jgi:hypothetical protein
LGIGAFFALDVLRFPLVPTSSCAADMFNTGSKPCPRRCSLTRRSQMQTNPSRPPVLKRSGWLGSQDMHLTVPSCPRRLYTVVHVSISDTWVDLSPEPVASNLSDMFHWTSKIPFSCGRSVVWTGSGSQINKNGRMLRKGHTWVPVISLSSVHQINCSLLRRNSQTRRATGLRRCNSISDTCAVGVEN